MEGLVMAAQFLLGLSFLVGVHEMGHLLAAKMFGMRVENFFIGFPPKVFGFKVGETEYALGAIPLGGFVKITGMVDESLDTDQLATEPQPWEFRSKPAWQRLIVMLGGIIVNVVTGIIIFSALVFFVGESFISVNEVNKYGIDVSPLGESLGLKKGDKIIKVNGQEVEAFNDLYSPNYILDNDSYYTVMRDGQESKVPIPADFFGKLTEQKKDDRDFIAPLIPYKVADAPGGMGAAKAGIKAGDQILEIEGAPANYFGDLQKELAKHKSKTVKVKILADGQEKEVQVEVSPEGTIGVQVEMLLVPSYKTYTLAQSLPLGVSKSFGIVWLQIKAFGKIFKGEVAATKSLSGPIGIAKIFGGTWDWLKFWTVTGMLSMVLAFMNLLPIPALDGGHVVFLLYEIVAGRPAPDKVLEIAQKVGMVLILALMVFAFGNDIYGLVMDFIG